MPKLSSRMLRRIVIGAVFLLVFTLTGFGLKTAVTSAPRCDDGIKNGQEEGIDCGLFACGKYCEPDLAPPKIISAKLIKAGESDYDFVAELENPHLSFGASEVAYDLMLLGPESKELLKREGAFYILPGQKKYVIIPFLTTQQDISDIKFEIKTAKWQKLESLEGMNLVVRREKYTSSNEGATLEAVIFNDSDFDFDTIDIDVILRNSKGDIIAVNRSQINTFVARTERGFKVIWPFTIKEKPNEKEIIPSTDLFRNSNFIKRYGSEIQKFQRYKE